MDLIGAAIVWGFAIFGAFCLVGVLKLWIEYTIENKINELKKDKENIEVLDTTTEFGH